MKLAAPVNMVTRKFKLDSLVNLAQAALNANSRIKGFLFLDLSWRGDFH